VKLRFHTVGSYWEKPSPLLGHCHFVYHKWETYENVCYDSLETWRKEKMRLFPESLERWNIYSHEWNRSKNGRMEQSKWMEYESWKVSSDVLKLHSIKQIILCCKLNFRYIYITCIQWPGSTDALTCYDFSLDILSFVC
jgi:hypothetical protein